MLQRCSFVVKHVRHAVKQSRRQVLSTSSAWRTLSCTPLIPTSNRTPRKSPFLSPISSFSTSAPQTLEFQAETKKLLDIVTNSIYTDKEVFIRELVSNASDALEKYRYKQVLGEVVSSEGSDDLEIIIVTDPDNKTLTIVDNGIGMTKDEMISNLGTIARSGSKQFVQNLKEQGGAEGIIGQFGVGFYSSFMVSDEVTVESVSASSNASQDNSLWASDGSGIFTVSSNDPSNADNIKRGSKITLKLKDTCLEFAESERIKSIIKRYSSFVAFPVRLNGEVVNTVSAIWTQDPKVVTTAQYTEFYKFVSNAFDSPRYTLHFRADAPLDLKCLFYIPTFHTEKFGMGRMEPGVNLYSRKVLIESKPQDLLPDWLRFVKGVVDSEDLPLSLSREKPQDSKLIQRIRDVLTRKLIRFLSDQMKSDPEKYREFYLEFNYFLKEGVCRDYKFMEQTSKLLMFESSAKESGEFTTFDDYISRSLPDEKNIYYLVAPSREVALKSPYYETFKKHNKEVLLLYNTIDDFVMTNVKVYSGRNLVSAETSSVDLDSDEKDEEKKDPTTEDMPDDKLSPTDSKELCEWLTDALGGKRVREVRTTNRLADSPAIVTDHESGALRRMMSMVNQQDGGGRIAELPPQILEVNPKHPIVVNLYRVKTAGDEEMAKLVAEQLLDNALIAAGLVDDPRLMLPRLNELMLALLAKKA